MHDFCAGRGEGLQNYRDTMRGFFALKKSNFQKPGEKFDQLPISEIQGVMGVY